MLSTFSLGSHMRHTGTIIMSCSSLEKIELILSLCAACYGVCMQGNEIIIYLKG